MYARLRGVPDEKIKGIVSDIVHLLRLEKWADSLCGNYRYTLGFFFCVRPQLRGEQFFRERANTTQRCNIVATLFGMVTTLPQHCNAVLR